jgi:hypothetical protein
MWASFYFYYSLFCLLCPLFSLFMIEFFRFLWILLLSKLHYFLGLIMNPHHYLHACHFIHNLHCFQSLLNTTSLLCNPLNLLQYPTQKSHTSSTIHHPKSQTYSSSYFKVSQYTVYSTKI